MQTTEIIAHKRDGEELSTEEIDGFIRGVVEGTIPDYQTAAWLMSIYLRGMSQRETTDLALSIAHSGEVLDLSDIVDCAVDKHSSGGVGDKTTLVVLPLVVACGVPVGKMSGRGLGFSGGTLDKMESIRGYQADLTTKAFLRQFEQEGIVLSGQSADLAPADGKLYALRDVTATVSSLPLIASSIMSKKIAAGADAVLLDVKVGLGAFMQTVEDAQRLARLMVDIGQQAGLKVTALISDMNQPLGNAVGNALEVREAIDALRGEGPSDLHDHSLATASHMLSLACQSGNESAPETFIPTLKEKLQNGEALEVFRRLVMAQGGDVAMVDNPDLLPKAQFVETVEAERRGYVAQVNARTVGISSMLLGAGRQKKGDPVDHAAGIVLHCKVGDYIEAGQPLYTLHANDQDRLAQAKQRLQHAITWTAPPTAKLPLFYDVI
jgi:pyrimidine-nucleoside phosphorylase